MSNPPDTREQARAKAHGLLEQMGPPDIHDREPSGCSSAEDRLTDYILERDAAHAAEVDRIAITAGACADEIAALRAEVATLTAQRDDALQNAVQVIRSRQAGKSIATEVLQLRSRLSTVERERDEARADLQAEANCLGETRDLLINLANGDDVMDDVRAWLRRPASVETSATPAAEPQGGVREPVAGDVWRWEEDDCDYTFVSKDDQWGKMWFTDEAGKRCFFDRREFRLAMTFVRSPAPDPKPTGER